MRILRILQHQRPHNRNSTCTGFVGGRVDMGEAPMGELRLFATTRFDLGPEPPGLAYLGLIPVRTVQRTEGAELKPAGIQFRAAFAAETKAADIGAPYRYSSEANI